METLIFCIFVLNLLEELQQNGFQNKVSYFRTRNKNDIIFQTTGRSTGLFDNVDKTVREGVETSVFGELSKLTVSMNYTWLKATFEDAFSALSPNHPNSSEDGLVFVQAGDKMPGIPEHQFKASAEYQLSDSISIGLDFLLNSGQFLRGDEANLLSKTPGYGLVNLRGRYKYNDRFEFYFKTTNLLDKDYVNFGMLDTYSLSNQ